MVDIAIGLLVGSVLALILVICLELVPAVKHEKRVQGLQRSLRIEADISALNRVIEMCDESLCPETHTTMEKVIAELRERRKALR